MHSRIVKRVAYLPILVLGIVLLFFAMSHQTFAYEMVEDSGAASEGSAAQSSGYTYVPADDCCAYVTPSEPTPEPEPPQYTYVPADDCCTYVEPQPEPTPEPPSYTYVPADDCCTYVAQQTPTPEPPVCVAFTASDYQVDPGDFVTVTWSTSGANSVSINGIGTVAANGSTQVQVNGDVTYTLTVNNADGSANCQVAITVNDGVTPPPPPPPPPVNGARCDSFTVSNTQVNSGDQVTLNWSTTNATGVSINNGIGAVGANGTLAVTVTGNTTYILTAQNANNTADCQVTVQVTSSSGGGGGGGGGGSSRGRCDSFTVSDRRVEKGDYVTLRWRTTRADDVRINHGIGDVRDDGERRVRIMEDTTFTLTVRDGRRTDTCRVSVEVDDLPVVTATRFQGSSIALARVPYTGFDPGSAFVLILTVAGILWAVVTAYFLMARKRDAL